MDSEKTVLSTRIEPEYIAWIEEASKALKQEPIKLELLEEALVA